MTLFPIFIIIWLCQINLASGDSARFLILESLFIQKYEPFKNMSHGNLALPNKHKRDVMCLALLNSDMAVVVLEATFN